MVDVWPFRFVDDLDSFTSILSEEERQRAERFLKTAARVRYVQTRAILRLLTSRLSQLSPDELTIQQMPSGKPFLPGSKLRVSVAHSARIGICAISDRAPIGVDVEQVRPLPEMQSIARESFSKDDRERLHRLKGDASVAWFFQCWTRREAYVKALGSGLTRSTSSIRFGNSAKLGEAVSVIDAQSPSWQSWLALDLQLAAGYAGALCFQNTDEQVKVHDVVDADALFTLENRDALREARSTGIR